MLFINANFFAQQQAQHIVDSLVKILPSLKGEKKADICNQVSEKFFDYLGDEEKALLYALQANELSKTLNYKKGLALSFVMLGRLKAEEEKYDEAAQQYFQAMMALNLAKRNVSGKYDQIILPQGDPEFGNIIGKINLHFGVTLGKKLNLSQSVQRYLESLRYYEASYEIQKSEFIKIIAKNGVIIAPKDLTINFAIDYLKNHPEDKLAKTNAALSSEILSGIRVVCRNLGNLFSRIKDNDQAIFYLKKSLKLSEELGSKGSQMEILINLGNEFMKMKALDSAIIYFDKLRQHAQKHKNISYVAQADQALGNAYSQKGELLKALEYHKHIDSLLQPLRNGTFLGNELYAGIGEEDAKTLSLVQSAYNYVFIGDIYSRTGKDNEKAKTNYLLAIETFDQAAKFDAIPGVAKEQQQFWLNRNLGSIYSKAGLHEKAISLLEKVIPGLNSFTNKEEVLFFYKDLFEAYDRKGDSKNGYQYYKKYIALKDTLFGQQNSNEIAEVQKRFEVEKKDNDIELLNKVKEAQDAELEKQKFVRNGFIAGSVILLLLAFVIFRSLQQNKKAKKIIEEQKKLVDEKNKDILDSIHYARRIQRAHLPTLEYLTKNLKRLMK